MGSWLIMFILILLLILSTGMHLLIHWDIKKMTNQLEGIIENFGTNELVRTNTHHKTLNQLVTKINQLIHLFKQDQQYTEKRERELKQEITNISHDLRTPLTSIKGFSELLPDPSLSEEERKEFSAIILKKIDNLTIMVDSFYELSQMDSFDHQIIMEKQFLDQIVPETMLMFYDDFEKNELNVQLDESNVSPILADRKATGRIVTNIIQNALRYAKNYVTISLMEEEAYVTLSAVNDTDAENRPELHRLFDRTFKQDCGRTDGQLGLGLHIVKRLIDKQGGTVTADVQENEFRIYVSFKKWHDIERNADLTC